jgi:hypothetical protein
MSFEKLHGRICDTLRGNRSAVMLEMLLPDGTHKIIHGRKTAKPMHIRIAEVRMRFSAVLLFIEHFAEARVRNIGESDPAPRFWRFKGISFTGRTPA